MLTTREELDRLNESEIREFAASLLNELRFKQALIDKLTHEMAVIKRLKFAAKAERFNTEQRSLLEDDTDADLQELAEQIEALQPKEEEREPPARSPQTHEWPSARRCRRNYPVARFGTSPRAPPAAVGVRSSGSEKTSARSWTTRLASSRWSVTSVVSGSAVIARRSPKRRCRHT